MMTYIVVRNLDTYYDDAWMALLSNTVIYLLSQPKTEWRTHLLKLCLDTFTIVYSTDPKFLLEIEGFKASPS